MENDKKVEKTKLDVLIVGDLNSGKKTLASALMLNSMKNGFIKSFKMPASIGLTKSFETESRIYNMILPGKDFIPKLMEGDLDNITTAIVVVSAEDYLPEKTKEIVNHLAAFSEVENVIVYISKADLIYAQSTDENHAVEIFDKLKKNISESLPGMPILIGSALNVLNIGKKKDFQKESPVFETTQDLTSALDKISNPTPKEELPFLMNIGAFTNEPDDNIAHDIEFGIVVRGFIDSGEVKVGDEIDLVGKDIKQVTVKSILIDNVPVDSISSAKTIDKKGNQTLVKIGLTGIELKDITVGMILTERNTIAPAKEFLAKILLKDKKSLTEKMKPIISYGTGLGFTQNIFIHDETNSLFKTVSMELNETNPIEKKLRFLLIKEDVDPGRPIKKKDVLGIGIIESIKYEKMIEQIAA